MEPCSIDDVISVIAEREAAVRRDVDRAIGDLVKQLSVSRVMIFSLISIFEDIGVDRDTIYGRLKVVNGTSPHWALLEDEFKKYAIRSISDK